MVGESLSDGHFMVHECNPCKCWEFLHIKPLKFGAYFTRNLIIEACI